MHQLHCKVSDEDWRHLQRVAKRESETVSTLVRRAIRLYLKAEDRAMEVLSSKQQDDS